jgi:thiamine biosynthesis lipoprotein
MGAQKLRSHGISSALINAGGDIVSIGVKRPGKPWRIGVQDPDLGRSIIAVIPLEDRSVVTSGDYERFFEIRGARYHHILDPKTGYPARGMRSVTIVADEAVNADALATAVFVMGGEKGMEFLNNLKNVAGMIMDGSGKLWVTQGDEGVFDLKGPKD